MGLESSRVLVTGGAGFIGSHVCEALLAVSRTPVILDNFTTGKAENIPGGCQIVKGDIRDLDVLMELVANVQSVVHLAAVPSVALSVDRPIETHGSNYVGTLNLLEAMRRHGLERIVYASSAAVYSPSDRPSCEDGPVQPSSPYGLDKLAGEHAIRIYGELHGVRGTSLRFFNIYGERQDPASPYSGVISIFMDRLSKGSPILIHGSGQQTRDFVYVRDLASLIVRLLDDREAPGLMNVGTGRSTSLLELVETLGSVLGRTPKVQHGPARSGDIMHSLADVARLRERGWAPETNLREGLSRLAGTTGG
jgi:UDP-glucose 4-epimerase